MKICVIMQGPPGSGKSWLANILAGVLDAVIHCTDDLRIIDGKYVFIPEETAEKHKQNQLNTERSMRRGVNVIIDNTNIRRWEALPYTTMARQHGYVVKVVRCEGSYSNSHGVPQDRVDSMRLNMESLITELYEEPGPA